MNKSLLSVLATTLLVFSVSTQATESKSIGSGTITFIGSIVEAPCELTPSFENGRNKLSSSCYNSKAGKMEVEQVDVEKLIKTNKSFKNNHFTMTPVKVKDNVYIMNMDVN